MKIVETQNLGILFQLERKELTLVRDVLLNPFRRRYTEKELWALRGLSFELEKGRVLGVIGENGAGKTTLLMVLAGIYAPDEGTLRVGGRVASLLEVGAGFRWELTGRENVFLYGAIMGISKKRIQKLFDEIVAFAGLEEFIDSPMRAYSSGMRMRLGFSVAMSVEPDVLLVDEALSIGDSAFQRRAMERIESYRQKGGTLVYVSHDMNSVGALCDDCLLLEKGERIAFGPPLEVIATYWERIWGKQVSEKVKEDEQQALDSVQNARRWGSGEILIEGFRLLDSEGEPARRIRQGRPFHIEIDFRMHEDPREFLFQVALFQGKTVVAILRSDPLTSSPGSGTKGGKARLRVDTFPLPTGEYQIDAEVRNEAFTRMYDHLEKFTSVEIVESEDPHVASDLLHLPSQWTLTFSEGEE